MFPHDIENTNQPDAAVVAAHNDMFRRSRCLGSASALALQGCVVLTPSVSAEGPEFIANAAHMVGTFDVFNEDNDPQGYHDFGAFEIDDKRLFWKIDMFEAGSDLRWGAETPDNPETTERVLTIMLASDW